MKSKWSIAGISAGLIFTLGSFIRYYVVYPDLDRMFAYCTIGLLISAVSFLYGRSVEQGLEITAMEDYLDDMNGRK